MRKTLNRVLACFLAVALLVSCCISGLVLPAAASTVGQNLITDGTFEEDNWSGKTYLDQENGYGGSKAYKLTGTVTAPTFNLSKSLVKDQVYVLRWKIKGGAFNLYRDYLVNNSQIVAEYSDDGWAMQQILFTTNTLSDTNTISLGTFYNQNTDPANNPIYLDDFELYEYYPGMNLMPATSCDVVPAPTGHNKTSFFKSLIDNGTKLSTVDDGTGNNVLLLDDVKQTYGVSANVGFLNLASVGWHGDHNVYKAGKVIHISYRYKVLNGATASLTLAASSGASHSVVECKQSTADENGWVTVNAKITAVSGNVTYAAYFVRGGSADPVDILVDDIFVGEPAPEVVPTISIDETATVEEGKTVTLNATAAPNGTAIEWTSSDDTIATVADGVVTGVKEGTVTITAKVADGITDTCTVTVTAVALGENLITNGDFEGAEWTGTKFVSGEGYGGGKALAIPSGTTNGITYTLSKALEADKLYVFRAKVRGGETKIWSGLMANALAPAALVGENTWSVLQCFFKPGENYAGKTTFSGDFIYYNRTDGTKTVYYDDVEIIEYYPGMNLMPASDGTLMAAPSGTANVSMFEYFYNNGVTFSVVDDGTGNSAWKLSGANTQNFRLGAFSSFLPVGTKVNVSFRYKSANETAATVSLASGSASYSKVTGVTTSEADANGWKTVTAEMEVVGTNFNYMLKWSFSGSKEVLIDDFSITEIVPEVIIPTIDITEDTQTVEEGKTVTLNATATPDGTAIEWTSSDDTVATVASGVVTGVKAGTVTITAKVADGITDTCEVTVIEPLPMATEIVLKDTTLHLAPKAFRTLVVKAGAGGGLVGQINWSSNNEAVATVDANGKVTAVADGTAVITGVSAHNAALTVTCNVTVDMFGNRIISGDFESAVDIATNAWSNFTSANGAIVQDPADASNYVMKLNPSKSFYYKFDSDLLKANKVYKISGRVKGSVSTAAQTGAEVYLNLIELISGSSLGWITPTTGSDGETWCNFEVVFATTGSTERSYCLYFKNHSKDGKAAYYDDIKMVEVILPVESLSMDAKAQLGLGVSTYMNYKFAPGRADISGLTWTSSDETVATVDNNGKVTTLKEGTTTITVKASETVSASCELTVVNEATSFTLSKEDLSLLSGGSATLYPLSQPLGSNIPGTLTWTSSNTAVATVDNNGKVTAVANGTAVITCTNGTITDTCTVKVSDYGELIVGGDFQDATVLQNWATLANGTTAEIVDDPYEYGNKCLVVNTGKTTGAYTGLILEADQLYMLTLRARGKSATVNINSNVVQKFYPADASARKTKDDTANWNTLTIRFRTKAAGTLSDVLSFVGNSAGVTYIDDVSLVKIPAVTGIAWKYETGNTKEIAPENSAVLVATPVPSDAFIESTITWKSEDTSIAIVDENGKVTGIKEGTTKVTATLEGYAPISMNIDVDYYAPVFHDGDFTNPTIKWAPLSGSTIQSGIVEGVGENNTNGFRLLDKSGLYCKGTSMILMPNATYKMTVRYKSKAVAKKSHYIWLSAGGRTDLESTKGEWKTVEQIFTVPISWIVDSGYQICIAASEETGIIDDIVIDSIDIRMYDNGIDAETATLNPPTKQMLPGENFTYMLTTIPSKANTNFMTWTSSDENVAIVEYGKVFAVGAGTATITAYIPSANGVVTATATVTVDGDKAFIKNGTFDIADDTSWNVTDATIESGAGLAKTNGLSLGAGALVTQTVTGLKAGSIYNVRLQSFRTGNRTAKVTVKSADGSTVYLDKTTKTVGGWIENTYEFTMPDNYDGSPLTFAVEIGGTNGTIVVDDISLTEGFSKADLIVSDILWNDGATQMKPGTPVNFTVIIANIGSEATKAGKDITVEIRVNAKTIRTLTYSDIVAANGEDGSLAVLTTDPADPWLAEEGELVVSAHVNTTMTVRESNNKNNGTQTFVRVADEILEAPQLALNGGFNSLVFSDDFDTANIDTKYTGDYGYKWYMTDLNGMSGDETDFRLTGNSTMILEGKNMNYNWLLCTMDAKTGAGWLGFTHGYLEFRTRFDHNPGPDAKEGAHGPAIWSFPPEAIATRVYPRGEVHVEMDWMEYWGDAYGDMHWTVTMHEQGDNGKQWMVNHGSYAIKGADKDIGDGEWHTVGYRWEKGIVIAYLDGKEITRQTWGTDGGNPPFNCNAGEFRENAMMQMDNQTNALILAATKGWPMEIDYIRVWQADGTVDAKPVLDSTFLEDHLSDENGDYFLDVNADNYEAIIDAMDAWLELSEEQQNTINAALVEKGGKEYGELLFEAQTLLGTVETFVSFYACDEYGDPYTTVDETNYEWILTAAEEWDSLTDVEREAINNKVLELCGMTFEDMLAAALNFGEGGGEGDEEIPSPEDGVPFPAVALVGLVLGGAAMIAGKKRRDEE